MAVHRSSERNEVTGMAIDLNSKHSSKEKIVSKIPQTDMFYGSTSMLPSMSKLYSNDTNVKIIRGHTTINPRKTERWKTA